MQKMKDQAIVCNIGHFDNEIQIDRLNEAAGRDEAEHQAAGRQVHVPRRPWHLHPGRGPAGESGLRHGPSQLCDVEQLRQPDAGADRPVEEPRQLQAGVYVLPKKLDEEVARLHFEKIGVKLTKLSQKQADYIGVPVEGPYKAENYRY
jgi:adenosylhomocysteinase